MLRVVVATMLLLSVATAQMNGTTPAPAPTTPPTATKKLTDSITPSRPLPETRTETDSETLPPTKTVTKTHTIETTDTATLTDEASASATVTLSDGSASSSNSTAASETPTVTKTKTLTTWITTTKSLDATDTETETASASPVVSITDTLSVTDSHSRSESIVMPTLVAAPSEVQADAIEFSHGDIERTVNVVAQGSPFDLIVATKTGSFDKLISIRSLEAENPDGLGQYLHDVLPLQGKTVTISSRGDGSIDVLFAHDPRFHIKYNEQVQVEFDKNCFALKQAGANVSITLAAPNRQIMADHAAVAAARVMSYSFSLGASAIKLRAGGVLAAPRADLLFRAEPCVFKMGAPLEFYYHPFTFPIGADRSRYYAGASIMNTVLVLGLLLVHASVAQFYHERHPGTTFRNALAFLYFPALPLIAAFFLFQHTLEASLVVAIHSGDATLQVVCGMIFSAWVLVAGGTLTVVFRGFGALFSAFPVAHMLGAPRSAMDRFLRGTGAWSDDDFFRKGNEGFCRMFGVLFSPYRADRHGFIIVELLVSVAYAAVGAVHPTNNQCGTIFIVLVVIEAIYLLVVLISRPMNATIDAAFAMTVSLFAIIAAALLASHAATEDSATLTTASWIVFALEMVIALRFLLEILLALHVLATTARGIVLERKQQKEDEALKKFLGEGESKGKERVTLASLMAGNNAPRDSDAEPEDIVLRYRHPRRKQRAGRWRTESAAVDDEGGVQMNPLGPRQMPHSSVFVGDSDNSEFAEMRIAGRHSRMRRMPPKSRPAPRSVPRQGHGGGYRPPPRHAPRQRRYSPSNSDTYDSYSDSYSGSDSYGSDQQRSSWYSGGSRQPDTRSRR